MTDQSSAADGTFLFPPVHWPGGVEQYVSFFMTTPVSDRVLSNLSNAYAARRDNWAGGILASWDLRFDNSPEALRFRIRRRTDEEIAEWRATKRVEEIERLAEILPRRIKASIVRPLARAAQMYSNSQGFTEAETAVIDASEVYRSGTGKSWTVEAIWNRWNLGEIMPDALTDSAFAMRRY